ncbi:MAG: magnesium transporter, partial [Alphaproteobacteria bacterium]|nr:magnesium transporter [Alphaproteobacteria bacterium]
MKKNSKKRKSSNILKYKKHQQQKQVLGLGPKIVNSVVIALNENDAIHILKIVEGLSEYDLAKLLEALDYDQRHQLVEILGDRINPEVFPELNDVVQEQIIDTLDENQLVHIVNELDSDDAVEILEHMDDEEQNNIIRQLSPELKHQVRSSLAYPEDSAGRIMSREFVSMPDNWTVKEAKKYLLTERELPNDFYDIFLTDSNMHPTGQIALDKLLRAKQTELLSNIMDCEVVPVDAYTDQEEVAHMFREYGWRSAMVVDNKCRLVGAITIDDVVHVIHEEVSEDIMHLSGTEEGDVYKSVSAIFRSRSIWLLTNLIATVVASSVVRGLEDIIAQISVLAVLMPI